MPKAAVNFLRMIGATVLALVCSGLAVVLFGALLPIWSMMLVYGRRAVQDSPGHGGIVFFLTIPLAALLALCGLFPLAVFFYQRFSR
jgi:hypothetical protein